MADVSKLGATGLSLWNGVVAVRKVTPTLEPVLMNACRVADNLDSIAETLDVVSLTVTNSRGDEVAHPLYGEHRQQSLALARLLGSLGIDKLEIDVPEGTKSIAEQVQEAVKAMKQADG